MATIGLTSPQASTFRASDSRRRTERHRDRDRRGFRTGKRRQQREPRWLL